MSLLDKLKSLLGLGGSRSSRDDREVGVTVERDGHRRRDADERHDRRRETDAGSERAVKETPPPRERSEDRSNDRGAEPTTEEPTTEDSAAPPETETDAGRDGSDEPDVEEPTEPESAEDADGSDESGDAEEESRVPSEAVDVIKGIGPTYADRLSEAGVETVADLAAAEADDLSERADVPEGRVENWIEQAEARNR